jgi:hypothetical protein
VAIGIQFGRMKLSRLLIGWICLAWLVIVAFLAHDDYLAYYNEITGGPSQGQSYLVDSNFDWGQNLKRLKQWMQKNHIEHIYLDCVRTPAQIQYLEIPCDLVTARQASKLREGLLVVSASHLVSPGYSWLRATRTPATRIDNTLFVYAMSESPAGQAASGNDSQ